MSDQNQGEGKPPNKQGSGETPKETARKAPAPPNRTTTAGTSGPTIKTAALTSSPPAPQNKAATFANDGNGAVKPKE
jgi:hypothetical protein